MNVITKPIMDFQEYYDKFTPVKSSLGIEHSMPQLVFNFNQMMSVQCGPFHYAERTDEGQVLSVEIGFPTMEVPEYILEYAEDADIPNDTVYPRVPIHILNKWIEELGGIIGTITYFK